MNADSDDAARPGRDRRPSIQKGPAARAGLCEMNQQLGEMQRRTLDAERQALTTKQREWYERFCRLLKNHELYRDEYAVKLARALGEETGIRLESEVRRVFVLAKANGRTKPVPS